MGGGKDGADGSSRVPGKRSGKMEVVGSIDYFWEESCKEIFIRY